MIRINPVVVGDRDGVRTIYAAFYCGELVAVLIQRDDELFMVGVGIPGVIGGDEG